MKLLKFIDKKLWLPLAISIAFVILPILIKDTSPALGSRNIFVNVSYSFIAAFIFYLLIDAAKRMRETEALAPYVSQHIRRLRGDLISICREAASIAGTQLPDDWTFNKAEMETICSNVLWGSSANMMDQHMNKLTFSHYLQDRARRSRESLNCLFGFSVFIGSEGARLVAELQQGYLKELDMLVALIAPTANMKFLAHSLDRHNKDLVELEGWARKNNFLLKV